MYYIIKRDSITWDTKPCENAVKMPILYTEVVFTDTRYWAQYGEGWKKDSNRMHYREETVMHHGVERPVAKQDFIAEDWVVDIDSMDDLLDFIESFGGCAKIIKDTGVPNMLFSMYSEYPMLRICDKAVAK